MLRRVLVATGLALAAIVVLALAGGAGLGRRIGAPGLDALVSRLQERLLWSPGGSEETTLPRDFQELVGTWSARDADGGTLWRVSFADGYAIRVESSRGYFHQGTAFVHWRLGLTDGFLRVPPGWSPLDVDVTQSSEPLAGGRSSLGAYSRSGERLRYCFGTPGELTRPVDDESRQGIRCLEFAREDGAGRPAGALSPPVPSGRKEVPPGPTAAPAAPETAVSRPPKVGVRDFHALLTVRQDGTILVHETLDLATGGVSFGGRESQRLTGIWRCLSGRTPGQHAYHHRMGFALSGATLDDVSLPTAVETSGDWFESCVLFGPDGLTLSPGEHRLTLDYSVDRRVRFLDDRDEIFWWVFGRGGHGWAESVERIGVTVVLPDGARGLLAELDEHAWNAGTGKIPGLLQAAAAEPGASELELTRVVAPRKPYLSVVATLPKGAVREPDFGQRVDYFFRDMRFYLPGLIGLTLFFAVHLLAWARVGRDPERLPVVPLFDPPPGCSPAVARRLRTLRYDRVSFAAALLDLAARGAVRVAGRDGAFHVERLPQAASPLPPDELVLLDALVPAGGEPRRELDALTIHRAYRRHRRHVESTIGRRFFRWNSRWLMPGLLVSLAVAALGADVVGVDRGYLGSLVALGAWTAVAAQAMRLLERKRVLEMRRPAKAAWLLLLFPPVMYAAAVAISAGSEVLDITKFMFLAPLFVMATANVAFLFLLRAPTPAGRRAMDQVEGFRTFLAAAEGDRLDRMTPTETTPALFQAYLPYALALGVENRWSVRFAGTIDETYTLPPLDVFLAALGRLWRR